MVFLLVKRPGGTDDAVRDVDAAVLRAVTG